MERRFNLKIQDELHEKVKNKAKEMNISMGSLVRIAVTEYLKKLEKEDNYGR